MIQTSRYPNSSIRLSFFTPTRHLRTRITTHVLTFPRSIGFRLYFFAPFRVTPVRRLENAFLPRRCPASISIACSRLVLYCNAGTFRLRFLHPADLDTMAPRRFFDEVS